MQEKENIKLIIKNVIHKHFMKRDIKTYLSSKSQLFEVNRKNLRLYQKSAHFVFHILFCSIYAVKTVFPPFFFYSPYKSFPLLSLSLPFRSCSPNIPLRLKPAGCSGYHTVETIWDKSTLLSHAHGTGYTGQGGDTTHPESIIYHLLCLANYKAQIVQIGMNNCNKLYVLFFLYASWFLQLHH